MRRKRLLLFIVAFLCPVVLLKSRNKLILVSYYYDKAGKDTLSNTVNNKPEIICLQNRAAAALEDYTFYKDNQANLVSGYKTDSFTHVYVNTRSFKTDGAKKHKFLVLYLQHKKTKQVIGIINTHLNKDKPRKISYESYIGKQLLEITKYISENHTIKNKHVNGWILCGNLNIDFKYKKDYEAFKKKYLLRWTDVDSGASGKSYNPQNTTLTTFKNKPKQRHDYIFYLGDITREAYQTSSLQLKAGQHEILIAQLALITATKTQFTITSCNVLAQIPYFTWTRNKKWNNQSNRSDILKEKTIVSSQIKLTSNDLILDINYRNNLFHNAFKESEMFEGASILCFQEWPYQHQTNTFHNKQVNSFNTALFRYTAFGMPDKDKGFEHYHGHTIAHDPKIPSHDGFHIRFSKTNWARAVIFTLLSGITLGVVSCHLPWSTVKQSLQAIAKEIKKRSKQVDHWIICGDFNWEVNRPESHNKQGDYKTIRKILPTNDWRDCDQDLEKQYLNNEKLKGTVTARNTSDGNKTEKIDYMFYMPQSKKGSILKLIKYSVYPKEREEFLPHRFENKLPENYPFITGKYFSDHGILRADFSLEKKSMSKGHTLQKATEALKEKLITLARKLR